MRWLDSIADSKDLNLSKCQEIMKDREAWRAAVHGATKSGAWLSDWKTTKMQERCHEKDSVSFADFYHLRYYSGFVTDKEKMAES